MRRGEVGLRVLGFCYRLGIGLYIVIVYSLFLSVADLALGHAEVVSLPPTVGALLFLAPLVVFSLMKGILRRPPLADLLLAVQAQRWPLFAFFLVVAWSLLGALLPSAYWGESMKWIFLIFYGFGVFLFSFMVALLPECVFPFRVAIFVSLALLFGSMMWDVSYPGTFSTEVYRAAGFPGNSNFASVVVNMLCAALLTFDFRRKAWFDFLVLALTLVANFVTQSRSGLVEFAVVLIFYFGVAFYLGVFNARRVISLSIGVCVAGAVLAMVIPYLMSSSAMFTTHKSRFASFASDGSMDSGSADSRYRAAVDAVRIIEGSPVLGRGTGYSRKMDVPPHNLYLQQWVNNGIGAVLSYVFLLLSGYYAFMIRNCRQGQAVILVAVVGSCFSHNILDQRTFLMLFGFLLGSTALDRQRQRAPAPRTEDEEMPRVISSRYAPSGL